MIQRLLVDRQSGIPGVGKGLAHRGERRSLLHGHDIGARRHDLTDGTLGEGEHTSQDRQLVLVGRLLATIRHQSSARWRAEAARCGAGPDRRGQRRRASQPWNGVPHHGFGPAQTDGPRNRVRAGEEEGSRQQDDHRALERHDQWRHEGGQRPAGEQEPNGTHRCGRAPDPVGRTEQRECRAGA